jgi:hypothetical protein
MVLSLTKNSLNNNLQHHGITIIVLLIKRKNMLLNIRNSIVNNITIPFL